MSISCLMSFYAKDSPIHLDEAFKSLEGQSLQATEIVVVQDGDVSTELNEVLGKWENKLPIKRLVNQKNMGLGLSLRKGLQACSYELVARMDADDICHPKRFEVQFEFLKLHPEISAVGSWVAEFSDSIDQLDTFRKLPLSHEELLLYAKKRCPLNHPSVMYRKTDVLAVGNYEDFRFQQDYHLWGRLLNAGFKIANVKEVLLFMRVNKELFGRRGGVGYFNVEVKVQREFLKIGFISWLEFTRNYIIRGIIRIIPNMARKTFYQRALR